MPWGILTILAERLAPSSCKVPPAGIWLQSNGTYTHDHGRDTMPPCYMSLMSQLPPLIIMD